MHRKALFTLHVALACSFVPPIAKAQDARASLVQRIAVAQGLTEMFEQQLSQQREATQAYVKKVYEQIIAQAGGTPNPRELAALERFVARCAELFSAREVVAAWVSHYGQDLSIQDLQEILRYYESPTGRKDARATKAAFPAFSAWMAQQGEARSTALISDFIAELRAARQ